MQRRKNRCHHIPMIWERIEAGFETLHASALFKQFQPGATDAEIDASEALLRITFPAEVRASYRIYRSSNRYELIGDPDQGLYELYSLPEIVRDWQHEVSEHGSADWLYAQEAGVDAGAPLRV